MTQGVCSALCHAPLTVTKNAMPFLSAQTPLTNLAMRKVEPVRAKQPIIWAPHDHRDAPFFAGNKNRRREKGIKILYLDNFDFLVI
jgi:hypothetical protein